MSARPIKAVSARPIRVTLVVEVPILAPPDAPRKICVAAVASVAGARLIKFKMSPNPLRKPRRLKVKTK